MRQKEHFYEQTTLIVFSMQQMSKPLLKNTLSTLFTYKLRVKDRKTDKERRARMYKRGRDKEG